MKKFVVLSMLFSSMAFADSVTISPGESITLQPTTPTQVTCSGSNSNPCSLTQNYGTYCATIAGNSIQCSTDFDTALASIAKLKASGLCD